MWLTGVCWHIGQVRTATHISVGSYAVITVSSWQVIFWVTNDCYCITACTRCKGRICSFFQALSVSKHQLLKKDNINNPIRSGINGFLCCQVESTNAYMKTQTLLVEFYQIEFIYSTHCKIFTFGNGVHLPSTFCFNSEMMPFCKRLMMQ